MDTRFKKGQKPWNKGKGKLYNFICKCGKKFKSRDKRRKYCSHSCSMKWNKNAVGSKPWNKGMKGFLAGEKHFNWKGGISKIDKLIRQTAEYKLWRSRVFERDNWTCQTCRIKGVYVEAHHKKELHKIIIEFNIKSLKDARRCNELWDLDNGVTLCSDCHCLTKGRFKKKCIQ